jgi:hypothetical protein
MVSILDVLLRWAVLRFCDEEERADSERAERAESTSVLVLASVRFYSVRRSEPLAVYCATT